ncbi:MAG: hypothetical protein Tsb0032_19840 [Kiloniellaceae bacterium]
MIAPGLPTVAVALTSVAVFALALWGLGMPRIGAEVLAVARGAVTTLRDPRLDDDARETAVQRAALRLFAAFFSILARSILTLLLSFAPIWLADTTRLAAQGEVLVYLSRWDIILVITIVMLAGYRLRTLLRTSC